MRILTALAVTAVFLLLASTASANDRFLFEIAADTMPEPVGSNDVVALMEDFVDRQGDFDDLDPFGTNTGTLDYLGIPKALEMVLAPLGTSLRFTIPSTGTDQTFYAADGDLSDQLEDWLQEDGIGEWARFLQAANGLAPLALLSGNPKSTVARMGSDPYRRFGFDDSRSRMGYDKPVKRWGSFELRIDAGASTVDAGEFDDDLWSFTPTLTLAGDFGRTVGLSFAIMGQYRDYNGAQLADLGLELALPLSFKRPEPHLSPWYWQLTPFVQAAAGVSIDLAAGGLFMGGGLVNAIGFNKGSWEFLLSNEMAYYGGIPIDNIAGYDFATELSQLFFKNGLEGTWWIGAGFYADAGIHFTNFALDAAAVSWYATPTIGVGYQAGRWIDIRIAYEGDLSTNSYRAHGIQFKLDFLF